MITHEGRTLDRRKVHGRRIFAQLRAEGARTRVAVRDGIGLDRIAATVATITPPVRSMSDLAIALDARSQPPVSGGSHDHDAGDDRPDCYGDGFTEWREDDDGKVWPTESCKTCDGTGRVQPSDADQLDPKAVAILADWRSAPTFAPFVHVMPRKKAYTQFTALGPGGTAVFTDWHG